MSECIGCLNRTVDDKCRLKTDKKGHLVSIDNIKVCPIEKERDAERQR